MKLWELIYCKDGVEITERVEGETKMEARGVIVRRYLCEIKFESVKEIEVTA